MSFLADGEIDFGLENRCVNINILDKNFCANFMIPELKAHLFLLLEILGRFYTLHLRVNIIKQFVISSHAYQCKPYD